MSKNAIISIIVIILIIVGILWYVKQGDTTEIVDDATIVDDGTGSFTTPDADATTDETVSTDTTTDASVDATVETEAAI